MLIIVNLLSSIEYHKINAQKQKNVIKICKNIKHFRKFRHNGPTSILNS